MCSHIAATQVCILVIAAIYTYLSGLFNTRICVPFKQHCCELRMAVWEYDGLGCRKSYRKPPQV